MSDATIESIREADVPDDIGRFPQAGHEHPNKYREHLVEYEGPLTFLALRGRAVDSGDAATSYMRFVGPTLAADARLRVREIVEG